MQPPAILLAFFVLRVFAQNFSDISLFYKCDSDSFGRLTQRDCNLVLNRLPDIRQVPATQRQREQRMFVEPQYLATPFAAVKNQYESEIEQLPKIYRFGKCRMALLPLADKEHAAKAITTTTWSFVEEGGLKVVRNCAGVKRSGGLVIVQDLDPSTIGAMVLYLYGEGSPFEARVTDYMIHSVAIAPMEFNQLKNNDWNFTIPDNSTSQHPETPTGIETF